MPMARYTYIWRNKWLTCGSKTVAEMSKKLRAAADELAKMAKDGVTLGDGVEDDYAELITTRAAIAKKYHFTRELEDSPGDY